MERESYTKVCGFAVHVSVQLRYVAEHSAALGVRLGGWSIAGMHVWNGSNWREADIRKLPMSGKCQKPEARSISR